MSALLGVAAIAALVYFNQPEPPPPVEPPSDRVVLLPDENGKVGKVVVITEGAEQLLATAYAGAKVLTGGKIELATEDAASVQLRYGAALGARPQKAVSYTVYFVSGREELTPESVSVVTELKAELARRAAPEVTVIGHTDRVGKAEANDALSIKRAQILRTMLIAQGVPSTAIEAAGRGEREPLVPTADEVAEPKNRRVEISVR
jgi:outer membrane protein OmpA-like peptidoglycan-associated protein